MDTIAIKQALFLISSAFLLAASYLWSDSIGYTVILFLIVLFYGSFYRPYTWWQGIGWAIFFYGIHWYGVFLVVLQRAEGAFKIPFCLLMIFYMALHAGAWFYLVNLIQQIIPPSIAWIFTTCFYFYYTERVILWIFGDVQGYPFFSLLIPLVSFNLIQSLRWIGQVELSLLLIFWSYLLAYVGYHFNIFITIIIFCMYLTTELCFEMPQVSPAWYVPYLGYVSPSKQAILLDQVQELSIAIRNLVDKHPHTKLILLPESALATSLDQQKHILYLLSARAECAICLGSHRKECIENTIRTYNSLYFIQNSRIIFYYDKQKLFPLTEYLPRLLKKGSFANLFLKDDNVLSHGSLSQNRIVPLFFGAAYTALCSEIFCNPSPIPHQVTAIIWLVNDSWFEVQHMRTLMFNCARLRSLSMQHDIIYVSHQYAYWISKQGFCYKIHD